MSDEPAWRKVGYIQRAHGIRGAVTIVSISDDPTRFVVGAVLRTDETPPREIAVVSSRPHKSGYLVTFAEFDSRDAAEAAKGLSLFVPATDRRTLDEDEYWPEDLAGLVVVTVTGDEIGVIESVLVGTAQDRLRVRLHSGAHAEIPFVSALVPVVDLAAGRVEVDLPVGLIGAGAIVDLPD